MKASVWGLLVAALAFGASTIYLSIQLKEERAQAAKLAEATRALNARIADLEKAREQSIVSGTFAMSSPAMGVVSTASPPPGEKLEASIERVPPPVLANPPVHTEAMQKMMRARVRANNKRMYADVGQQLGLNKEDTSRLLDILTDQQVDGFSNYREGRPTDPAEVKRRLDEAYRANQAELESFLGASRMEQLREYQQSIPARQELETLTRQLEGSDAPPLSDKQQERLLTALVEERKRIPMPRPADSATSEAFAGAYTEWQNAYDQRVNAQAQVILNPEQLAAYNEYQQWQKEMREQSKIRRQIRGQRVPGSSVELAVSSSPVMGEAVTLVPAPEEKPRKAQ